MDKWKFPSRGFAETEGFSNAGLAEFKGNPLQALAREVCQNSLDAADGSGKPVRVEFHNEFLEVSSFPGMADMKNVIKNVMSSGERKVMLIPKTFLLRLEEPWNRINFLY